MMLPPIMFIQLEDSNVKKHTVIKLKCFDVDIQILIVMFVVCIEIVCYNFVI